MSIAEVMHAPNVVHVPVGSLDEQITVTASQGAYREEFSLEMRGTTFTGALPAYPPLAIPFGLSQRHLSS